MAANASMRPRRWAAEVVREKLDKHGGTLELQ